MSDMTLKDARDVETAPLAALGLLGGYVSARETGVRPLGGVLLGLAGAYAGRTWLARGGVRDAALLSGIYIGGFALSHPLAKKIGAWPAVLSVTAANAVAAYVLSDSKE